MQKHGITKRIILVLLAALPALAPTNALQAQGKLEDYERAEKFLPGNARKLVFNATVAPNWIGGTARFWYRKELRDGKAFLLVDPARNTVLPAFDQERLASALSAATGVRHTAKALPFDAIRFSTDGRSILFDLDKTTWTCDLQSYVLKKEDKKTPPRDELPSPDGRWTAFVKDFNLHVRNAATGETIALTRNGEEFYGYGRASPELGDLLESKEGGPSLPVEASWSPDSKKILTWRFDERNVKRHTLLQFAPPGENRAKVYSWFYALPGDEVLPKGEPCVLDLETKVLTPLDVPPLLLDFLMWKAAGRGVWSPDGRKIYVTETVRGCQKANLYECDPATGRSRLVLTETSTTCVDPHMTYLHILGDGAELIWGSERDGWCRLYLLDGRMGAVKNAITEGGFVVQEILRADAKTRQVWMIAGGREAGRDPYYRHLYQAGFDGSGLRLLTPEDADHSVRFSPDGIYFTDTFSKVDTAPVTVVRRVSDGRLVRELEKADLGLLLEAGWPRPEPFRATGRDGKTAVYGVVYRPSNFSPFRRYPVIDAIYNGPQAVRTPKSFQASSGDQALAELGFIVVAVDGMGTAMRSKAFHNVSWKNLGDSGLEDHILAFRELAAKYAYMDLERVGIYGHSAGGYDSAHALLVRPDFYKVAVSSSGCHDNRSDKVWWNELWMGYPVGEHYRAQANPTLAANLRGKLLLVHGDLDDNVHPAATLQLVDALIKANKNFDLLIMPGRRHGLGNGYFVRKRWDYFVTHLLGVEPPKEYPLKDPDEK